MDDFQELARMGRAAMRVKALQRAEQYRWFIEPLIKQRLPYEAIRRSLVAYRLQTPSGRGTWTREMVRRIALRLELREVGKAA